MIIEVDVYQQIWYLHEQKNTSQREIARILGISRTTVKKYLNGATVPCVSPSKELSALCVGMLEETKTSFAPLDL